MNTVLTGALIAGAGLGMVCAMAQNSATLAEDGAQATLSVIEPGDFRTYELTSTAELRDNKPADHRIVFSEPQGHPRVRTGNALFDGLYALALHEALLDCVGQIQDGAYGRGQPLQLDAFQTGEFWTYVWTRDLAYSVHLALAGFDPQRAVNSLLFKASTLKPSVTGGFTNQIVQDTGSGGSYPVSSDRVVWALGAAETLQHLDGAGRDNFLKKIYPVLRDTIEQDRRLVFDPGDGLYRGEQSFLDWREQSYPGWTRDNVLPIAMSKALSVNAAQYYLLTSTAGYARRLGRDADASRYAVWAGNLKASINARFFDPEAGLYGSYLLSDGVFETRVHRYDLLGESLAILLGIADPSQAEDIVKHYPVGPHGPPVVWPEERTVPIYHNQAIWPFVTAYWTKAARKSNNPEAVNLGLRSLEELAAFNLSNMENFDFVTGRAEVKGRALNGPVINSRRQLWSVAGYLAAMQDVLFGLETSWDSIRFRPYLTAEMRNGAFAKSDQIELLDFACRNTRHQVRVHLPPARSGAHGVCPVERVELNGKSIGGAFATAASLQHTNQWDIYLQAPKPRHDGSQLRTVDVTNDRALFGPVQPTWDDARQGGVTVENRRLVLHYRHDDGSNVNFNIYRDGQLCAKGVRQTQWADPLSGDYRDAVHYYTVEAVDRQSGNASHLSPPRCHREADQEEVIPARDMRNRGGTLVGGHHFENWGQPGDELRTGNFKVRRGGRYVVRAEFANGSGPVNTGITCAVKKLEISQAGRREALASGYLVMPQSGDWSRWDLSSPVCVNLKAGEEYAICIREDEYSRNMSCLKSNERYTAGLGGGDRSYNYVNIAALHLLPMQCGASFP